MTGTGGGEPHLRLRIAGAQVLFTTRAGGVSEGPYASLNLGATTGDDPARVAANRERARRLAGVGSLALGQQVHGAAVVVDGDGSEQADGQVCTQPGIAAAVLVADCLPVAIAGPLGVGMLHAGWRGLAAGVVEAGARALGGDVRAAAIGPGIGGCCYEVGDDVRAALGASGARIDLAALARERLRALGVTEIVDCGLCTACHPELLFSHRRDGGATGRQAGLAWVS